MAEKQTKRPHKKGLVKSRDKYKGPITPSWLSTDRHRSGYVDQYLIKDSR